MQTQTGLVGPKFNISTLSDLVLTWKYKKTLIYGYFLNNQRLI